MAKVIDFLKDLSYLLGEDSVPTTGLDSRIGFINRICEDITSRHRWSWNTAKATLTIVSSSSNLPTNFRTGGILWVKDSNGNELSEVDERLSNAGKKTYYINGDDTAGYVLTVNGDDTTLDIEYCKKAPLFLNSTDNQDFPVPIKMAVARGALIDVRRSENPFADVAPETQEYENEVKKIFKLERQLKGRYQLITSKAHYNGTNI